MGNVYIAFEDEITEYVLRRLLKEYTPKATIIKSMPNRGSELKANIDNLNRLANFYPVILLTDSDDGCAPTTKALLLKGIKQNDNFIINIAYDEVEAWLMADRDNFATFLHIDVNLIPQPQISKRRGQHALIETDYGIKASFFLTHKIAPKSTSKEVQKKIAATGTRCKGAEYNSGLKPFIDIWNIEIAATNSDSLQRMIKRLIWLNNIL